VESVKVKEGAERVKVSTGFDWRYPVLFRSLHRFPTMSDAYPPLDNALLQRLHALGVRPADVEERFVRGTGPGGQKINKTSSTVWLRHGPTGVEVRCQRERSQADNRAVAWAELADRVEKRGDGWRPPRWNRRAKRNAAATGKKAGARKRAWWPKKSTMPATKPSAAGSPPTTDPRLPPARSGAITRLTCHAIRDKFLTCELFPIPTDFLLVNPRLRLRERTYFISPKFVTLAGINV
jgi:hypothetical protein